MVPSHWVLMGGEEEDFNTGQLQAGVLPLLRGIEPLISL